MSFYSYKVFRKALKYIFFIILVAGHSPVFSENLGERPVMQSSELLKEPLLDGLVLGDKAWDILTPATGFQQIEPDDGLPASQKTEVYIGFLKDALYVGLIAYDNAPDQILATDSRRDSSLDNTDSFQLIIDGLRDGQNGFIFGTNPAGIQYDGQVIREGSGGAMGSGGGGFNLNWDGSWEVVTSITEIGWSAEIRIPFSTLRYGSDDIQTWGINFQRNIGRNNETAFWAPLSRQHKLYRLSEAGTLMGIKPTKKRNLQFSPYLLGQSTKGGNLLSTQNNTEAGFDIKYSITPSLTLDATYNTDFAQVEADEQQMNLDRFSLFFKEKRPFFLENAAQFSVGDEKAVQMFFSRRIGISSGGDQLPIIGGARLSGKIAGNTNVGFLHMHSEAVAGIAPGNKFTVARVNQELPSRSSLGFMYVGRDGDGSHLVSPDDDKNHTYSIDGRLGIGENFMLEGWLAKTSTPGREGRDEAFSAKAIYNSSQWLNRFEYGQVGEDFNPEVGFLKRSNYRRMTALILRRIRPKDTWGLLEVRPHISYTGFWDFDGFHETGFLHIDNHWEFRNGYRVDTGVNFTREGVQTAFDIIDGVTIQPGTYDHHEAQIRFNTDKSDPLSLSSVTYVGGRFGGNRIAIKSSIIYRVGESFRSELIYNYNKFDLPIDGGQFNANLTQLRLSYAFTPKILLQALVQHNQVDDTVGTNLRFSWLQTANSGFFLVYNEVDERGISANPRGKEVIFKYSHIFDVFN